MKATAYDPGTTGGNREDISDTIVVIEPTEAPVFSSIPRGKPITSTLFECVASKYRDASTKGTQAGTDVAGADNQARHRKRFGGRTHRLLNRFAVDDVQQAISRNGGVAGVNDEYEFARMAAIVEMKRDGEAVVNGEQDGTDGNDADMRTRGAGSWISNSAQTDQPVPSDYRTPSGSIITGVGSPATFTETNALALMKSVWQQRGAAKSYLFAVGENLGSEIDRFARDKTIGPVTVNLDSGAKTIDLEVTGWSCAFGRFNKVLTQFMSMDSDNGTAHNANEGHLMHLPEWEIRTLEEAHTDMDPKGPAGQEGWAKHMFGLGCKAPKGQGRVAQ